MPLVLDLLRHGEAEAQNPGGDHQRALTPRGEQSIRALSVRLARDGWRPDRAFSSPTRRARDTASILTRGADLALPIEELPELMAEVEPSSVLDALTALGVTDGHVLLVGHQPQMGRLVALLTGVERGLTPGDLARIELPAGPGSHTGRLVLELRAER